MVTAKENFHYAIIFQITQECPFQCDICLRFYSQGNRSLSQENRFRMVEILKNHDVKSVSITGGEPLVLKDNLFDFLKYLHQQRIHTCLDTTGFTLNKPILSEMDKYLDRMVISIRSLDIDNWKKDFGDTPNTLEQFETVLNLLQWIKETNIVLEVTTVVHRENIARIVELGQLLAEKNSNIVWRVDEYYPIGKGANNRNRFELDDGQFSKFSDEIRQRFRGIFKDVKFSSWEQRQNSPGLLITQSGDIMDSAGQPTGKNILENELPSEFRMSKPWSEYRKVCRDWGWEDL